MVRAVAPALRSFSQASRTLVLPPVICPPISLLMYCFAGRRELDLDASRPTPSSSADQHGQRGVDALAHLGAIAEEGDRCRRVPMCSHALAVICFAGPALLRSDSGLLQAGSSSR